MSISVDDNLKNDSVIDLDTSIAWWEKNLSRFPIHLWDKKFSFESTLDWVGTIKFKDCSELYLKRGGSNFENINKSLIKKIEVCNLILQKRTIPEEYKEYFQWIKGLGIDMTNVSVISHLLVFLKFVSDRNYTHSDMNEKSHTTTEVLEKLLSCDDYREYMGDKLVDSTVWQPKTYSSGFSKTIWRRNWDATKSTDLSRCMNEFKTFSDAEIWVEKCIEYLHKNHKNPDGDGAEWQWVEKVSLNQYTGNYMRKSQKPTGYRDINILVKLSGIDTPIEIQFHYEELLNFKTSWILFSSIIKRYQENDIFFSQEEITILEKINIGPNEKLPNTFIELCKNKETEKKIDVSSITDHTKTIIVWDELYHISRQLDSHPELQEKFRKMEYYGYAQAMGVVRAQEYMENLRRERSEK